MTRSEQSRWQELETLEAELETELVRHLEAGASGRDSLGFVVSALRPEHWPPTLRSPMADTLYAMAERILELRARGGLRDDGIPARLFLDACLRHVDLDDPHRLGPKRQAEALLCALGRAE